MAPPGASQASDATMAVDSPAGGDAQKENNQAFAQDRQARGIKPESRGAKEGPDNEDGKWTGRVDHEWDSYEAQERRKWAAAILGSEEKIAMWAESRNDSIAGTRYHFLKIMAGYEEFSP